MEDINKKRALWFSLINLFLAIATVAVVYVTLNFGTLAGQVDLNVSDSWLYIITFTVQSNILIGLVGLVCAIYGFINLKKSKPIPKVLLVLDLMATSAGMLTVFTVLFFLAPRRVMQGRSYFDMILGPMFFFHLFNPLLSAFALIFLTPKTKFTVKECFFAIIPPVAYAIPYVLNVVILHTWYDFYGFTFGGKNWTVLPVFLVVSLVTFGIASGIAFLHNRRVK